MLYHWLFHRETKWLGLTLEQSFGELPVFQVRPGMVGWTINCSSFQNQIRSGLVGFGFFWVVFFSFIFMDSLLFLQYIDYSQGFTEKMQDDLSWQWYIWETNILTDELNFPFHMYKPFSLRSWGLFSYWF